MIWYLGNGCRNGKPEPLVDRRWNTPFMSQKMFTGRRGNAATTQGDNHQSHPSRIPTGRQPAGQFFVISWRSLLVLPRITKKDRYGLIQWP